MNLDKELIHIKTRKTYPKSFITDEEKELAIDQTGKFNEDLLPRETVGNVILNCLALVPVETKLDGFYSNTIAQRIFDDQREIELKEKLKKFLTSLLERAIMQYVSKDDKTEMKGVYAGWVISQVLEEVGEKFDE